MTSAKRLSSTPPGGLPRAAVRTSRSGIQPLQQAEPEKPDSRERADTFGVDTVHLSREALVQALDEVSWTAEKQARVIEGLERLVQQLQRDMRKERLLSERSQKQMLNEQDQFIQGLLGEHEEVLTKVMAERDEALRQIERLEALIPPGGASHEAPGVSASEAAAPGRATSQEAVELRQQLGLAKRRVGKLTSECRRSRDVLHRVMRQRDEAQLAVAQLMHEIRDTAPHRHASNPAPWQPPNPEETPGPEGTPPSDWNEPGSDDATQAASSASAPARETRDDRPTPTATTSPSIHPTPLAIALASTDPQRRRSRKSGSPDFKRESTTLPGVAPEAREQPAPDAPSEDDPS